ncbi:MAG: aldo/keto reductase [Bacilli bacterium]|nr:aldo/keto reductase [Bacilli bacterium]
MKYINIKNSDLVVSNIALGCMRISNKSVDEVESLVKKAVDLGINFFDHADIYGAGKSEELFGEVLLRNPGLREKIIIQSKCGIRRGYYDSSKEHIITSVENSLKRLKTSYLDVLLIHRPDTLMELEEISEAFKYLYDKGLVRYFGVSNMNQFQVELIERNIDFKLLFNQLQFSIVHSILIDEELNVNMKNNESINHGGSILDYSRLNNITIQAWSVLQASWEEGSFLGNPKYRELNEKLYELSLKYNVKPSAIAIAWILRHPAKMQAIVGTTSLDHLEEIAKANDFVLERKEYYDLYLSVNKILP